MNKVTSTLTICAICFGTTLMAQNPVKITQVVEKVSPLKSIELTTGASWDSYKNLNMNMLADRTVNMPDYKSKTQGMEENAYMTSIGLTAGANLIWAKPQLSNSLVDVELRTGASINLMKEGLIEYNDRQSNTTESLMYCFVENDIKVGSDMLVRFGDKSKFSFYTGLGVNASGSFNNKLLEFSNYYVNTGVMNEFNPNVMNTPTDQNTYEGKNVLYARAYIPIGVSVKLLRHLEGTMELKLGKGMEQVVGGNATSFNTGEFGFGLRYNIQKNKAWSIFDFI